MVWNKLMSKTCFFLNMTTFSIIFLHYVAEMSENEYLHCVGHVVRLLKHI